MKKGVQLAWDKLIIFILVLILLIVILFFNTGLRDRMHDLIGRFLP